MVCSLNTQINNFIMNLNNAAQFIRKNSKNYRNYIQLLILICCLYMLQLLTLLFVCGVSWNNFFYIYAENHFSVRRMTYAVCVTITYTL